MNDREFLKLAYAKGKIEEILQAFIDYLPEE